MIRLTKKNEGVVEHCDVDMQLTYNNHKNEREIEYRPSLSVIRDLVCFFFFFLCMIKKRGESGEKEHRRNYLSVDYHSIDQISNSSEKDVSSSLYFVFTFVS